MQTGNGDVFAVRVARLLFVNLDELERCRLYRIFTMQCAVVTGIPGLKIETCSSRLESADLVQVWKPDSLWEADQTHWAD